MIACILIGVADPGNPLLIAGLDILKEDFQALHPLVKRATVAGKAISDLIARLGRHYPEPANAPLLNLFQPLLGKVYDLLIAVRSHYSSTSHPKQKVTASKTAWHFRHRLHWHQP